jgi:pyridoxal 5'-phosphate synthase pdxT subunit
LHSEEIRVGILAIQGAFQAHYQALKVIPSVTPVLIRYPHQLDACSGLILPGGESTTQKIVGSEFDWLTFLASFDRPILGTCAGLILMSQLGHLDIEVMRNGFGPQKASFSETVTLSLPNEAPQSQTAIFIRAPRITKLGNLEVLAAFENGEPICVQQGIKIGCTFHPELCTPSLLHLYFCSLCSNKLKKDLLPL